MISAGSLALPSGLVHEVTEAEYARLLGYPKRRIPDGRARTRANEAREWFERNGSPWAFTRRIEVTGIDEDQVHLADGRRFESSLLAKRWRRAEVPALVLAAASAGSEIDRRSERLWEQDRPDEAYFLDRFGAAVVEHLATWTAGALRGRLAGEGVAVLPGYSPGYEGWDMAQQTILAESLLGDGVDLPPGPIDVLSSGMIEPKNSLLSVFGLTRDSAVAEEEWSRHRCSWCSLPSCSFRQFRFLGAGGAT